MSAIDSPEDLSHRDGALARRLEAWFWEIKRLLPWRESYDPFHILVSEVMLQQTRMDVVVDRFVRFIDRFPTIESLARASEEDVVAEWSGLGYYRRARMLHAAARAISSHHGGRVPSAEEALLAIPGVGRYTAGAIGSIAFDLPRPIVDGNVLRVFSRLDCIEGPLRSNALEKAVWSRAVSYAAAADSPRLANQALMELGSLVCKPQEPLCEICPVATLCEARITDRVRSFPQPKVKGNTLILRVPLLIVRSGAKVLFQKGTGSLLRGMWHLPHGDPALMPEMSISHEKGNLLGEVRHTITNRRITFEVYEATLSTESIGDGREALFLSIDELLAEPHPSYVKKALALAARVSSRA